MLTLKNISLQIGKHQLLSHASASFSASQIHLIEGRNGVGKSSLLKMMAGILKPQVGSVLFDEVEMENELFTYKVATGMGLFIERPVFYSHLTVKDNIRLQAAYYQRNFHDVNDRLMSLFGFERLLQEKAAKLSMGQKQLLGLSLCFVHEPKLLLLDEPMSYLDKAAVKNFLALMEKLREEVGTTFIIASHSPQEFSDVIDQRFSLEDQQLFKRN